MRRILLGGLGIALGVFTPAAVAQQPASNPPTRAAALGRPSAIPDAPAAGAATDPGIQPAGLFRNNPARQTVTYAPGAFGAPTPVIAQPPGTPAPMSSDGVPMMVSPGGAPRPVTGAPPMITESRGDPTGRIPNGTLVPSVGPDGFVCPDPGLESPLYDGGRTGLSRLGGCGRNWVSAELLMWWSRSTQVLPPSVVLA